MYSLFDNKAQKVIVIAESLAFDFGHEEIGSQHLLLSLLKNKESFFTKELEKQDIDEDFIANEISVHFGEDEDLMPITQSRSSHLSEILDKSIKDLKKTQKCSLENLIYSLLTTECWATDVLDNNGVNTIQLAQEVKERMEDIEMFLNLEGCESFTTVFNPSKKKIILGRDKEVKNIEIALSCREKCNVALLGNAGVGKTAIVEELARVLKYNPPKNLKGYQIVSLDTNAALAGTKYRGEFEEKMDKFLKAIKGEKVIVFIDEGHSLTQLGNSEGATSLSEILKPILTKKEYKFIIATTSEEYEKFLAENKALSRRFRNVHILEPEVTELPKMLKAKIKDYSQYHDVSITDDDVETVIQLAKDIPNRYFPDKALDVIDFTMSNCNFEEEKKFNLEFARDYISLLKGEKKEKEYVLN